MKEPNRESVPAVKCDGFDAIIEHGPGGYEILETGDHHSLVFIVPGETDLRSIEISKSGQDSARHIWGWNGDYVKPTLTPSILAYDRQGDGLSIELWHGYLTDGVFKSC